MIRLPICFGDKLKSKNLEVNFLVVDVPTTYNVILGHPTLHKGQGRKKKEQEKRGGSHIRLSTILMSLLLRSPSLSIEGVSCLIPCALTLTRKRNKFHLLGVSAFILDLLAVVCEVEVGVEIVILLKLLSQHHQDLVQIPQGIGIVVLTALLLGLSHPFSPCSAFSFSNATSIGSPAPPAFGTPSQLSPPQANASAIVTSSSVILGESKVPEVAKSQDLTKS
ncbi:hypothetical protein Cgig2_009974 [Carnegiea gigantea]|uniref:Uncharacterized protein n=1 Tax=Carnegiea gigantea TaxID=171969 RepID=A0A9Q1Q4L7_9CARY|nr:hypothetical protein Cgig2_009974 [Carnegiea gigantea]